MNKMTLIELKSFYSSCPPHGDPVASRATQKGFKHIQPKKWKSSKPNWRPRNPKRKATPAQYRREHRGRQ